MDEPDGREFSDLTIRDDRGLVVLGKNGHSARPDRQDPAGAVIRELKPVPETIPAEERFEYLLEKHADKLDLCERLGRIAWGREPSILIDHFLTD